MYQEYLNQLQASIAPMGSEELKELLNNDDKLDEKVDEVLQVLRTQKTSVFEDNRSRAERNIEREPQIIELRGRLAELSEEGRTRCSSVQEKLSQLKEKSGGVGPETALALLQTAASESEEQTEEMVKKFNDSDLGVEPFLEEFLASRRTMHLRRLKAEKMQDLMRKQRHGPPNASLPAYGNVPSGGFYPSAGVSAPYPLGPMMPMPPPSRPY
ncbi:vacuolar protein sorting-associated protein 37B [Drosophila takahashii]|uniref:vacuolar protein sorting-associated protein 37B n=1 Tax=Drosophila takahashii TaxID=29030 RepID=UPI0007E84E85|nr:vacuolar protein sorting-associated protein 37C [Drosophila takahashii]XP_017009992.1 vacuolar protein sorting-associated protein 37C [Drosophila takahashii]